MNTVDNPAGSPADGLEAELVQYLLSAKPLTVVIIGQPPGGNGLQQQLAGTPGPEVMPFDSLEQCLARLPETVGNSADEATGHCIALMQFEPHGDASGESDLAASLGQAVRRFPERLVVSIDTKEPDDAAFFAFGFRKLQLDDQGSIRLFEYCLSEYKQVPDWLNARYWANPERYGLTDDHNSYSEDGEDDEEE